MTVNIHKPVFNKRIFRDANFDKIDQDAKANFVIERVFEREMWKTSASAGDITEMKK